MTNTPVELHHEDFDDSDRDLVWLAGAHLVIEAGDLVHHHSDGQTWAPWPQDNNAALDYAARGVPVLPVHCPTSRPGHEVGCSCGDPGCGSIGKHPITAHGLKDASTNREQIEWWWRRFPHANVGLATEHVFDVLDIDGPIGERFIRRLPADRPLGQLGPVVRTGGGGWHVYLAPTGLGNPKPRDLEKVDWRGRGGYVLAPPSRHASGRRYRWVRDLDTPLPEVPPALRERLERPQPIRAAVPAIRPATPGHPYGQRA